MSATQESLPGEGEEEEMGQLTPQERRAGEDIAGQLEARFGEEFPGREFNVGDEFSLTQEQQDGEAVFTPTLTESFQQDIRQQARQKARQQQRQQAAQNVGSQLEQRFAKEFPDRQFNVGDEFSLTREQQEDEAVFRPELSESFQQELTEAQRRQAGQELGTQLEQRFSDTFPGRQFEAGDEFTVARKQREGETVFTPQFTDQFTQEFQQVQRQQVAADREQEAAQTVGTQLESRFEGLFPNREIDRGDEFRLERQETDEGVQFAGVLTEGFRQEVQQAQRQDAVQDITGQLQTRFGGLFPDRRINAGDEFTVARTQQDGETQFTGELTPGFRQEVEQAQEANAAADIAGQFESRFSGLFPDRQFEAGDEFTLSRQTEDGEGQITGVLTEGFRQEVRQAQRQDAAQDIAGQFANRFGEMFPERRFNAGDEFTLSREETDDGVEFSGQLTEGFRETVRETQRQDAAADIAPQFESQFSDLFPERTFNVGDEFTLNRTVEDGEAQFTGVLTEGFRQDVRSAQEQRTREAVLEEAPEGFSAGDVVTSPQVQAFAQDDTREFLIERLEPLGFGAENLERDDAGFTVTVPEAQQDRVAQVIGSIGDDEFTFAGFTGRVSEAAQRREAGEDIAADFESRLGGLFPDRQFNAGDEFTVGRETIDGEEQFVGELTDPFQQELTQARREQAAAAAAPVFEQRFDDLFPNREFNLGDEIRVIEETRAGGEERRFVPTLAPEAREEIQQAQESRARAQAAEQFSTRLEQQFDDLFPGREIEAGDEFQVRRQTDAQGREGPFVPEFTESFQQDIRRATRSRQEQQVAESARQQFEAQFGQLLPGREFDLGDEFQIVEQTDQGETRLAAVPTEAFQEDVRQASARRSRAAVAEATSEQLETQFGELFPSREFERGEAFTIQTGRQDGEPVFEPALTPEFQQAIASTRRMQVAERTEQRLEEQFSGLFQPGEIEPGEQFNVVQRTDDGETRLVPEITPGFREAIQTRTADRARQQLLQQAGDEFSPSDIGFDQEIGAAFVRPEALEREAREDVREANPWAGPGAIETVVTPEGDVTAQVTESALERRLQTLFVRGVDDPNITTADVAVDVPSPTRVAQARRFDVDSSGTITDREAQAAAEELVGPPGLLQEELNRALVGPVVGLREGVVERERQRAIEGQRGVFGREVEGVVQNVLGADEFGGDPITFGDEILVDITGSGDNREFRPLLSQEFATELVREGRIKRANAPDRALPLSDVQFLESVDTPPQVRQQQGTRRGERVGDTTQQAEQTAGQFAESFDQQLLDQIEGEGPTPIPAPDVTGIDLRRRFDERLQAAEEFRESVDQLDFSIEDEELIVETPGPADIVGRDFQPREPKGATEGSASVEGNQIVADFEGFGPGIVLGDFRPPDLDISPINMGQRIDVPAEVGGAIPDNINLRGGGVDVPESVGVQRPQLGDAEPVTPPTDNIQVQGNDFLDTAQEALFGAAGDFAETREELFSAPEDERTATDDFFTAITFGAGRTEAESPTGEAAQDFVEQAFALPEEAALTSSLGIEAGQVSAREGGEFLGEVGDVVTAPSAGARAEAREELTESARSRGEALRALGIELSESAVGQAQEEPAAFAGGLFAGAGAGVTTGAAVQRLPAVARSANIRARGGEIVDFEDLSDPPARTGSDLPGFTEAAQADPEVARQEFLSQARASDIAGDQPVAFSGRSPEAVREFGGFGREFEAPEGSSELPGQFFAADLSPLRIEGTGESGGLSVGLPRMNLRSSRILAEEDVDVGITRGTTRGEVGEFLSESASREQSFIRTDVDGGPTGEQEVIAPPGSLFEESAGIFGVRVGRDVVPGRLTRRVEGESGDIDIGETFTRGEIASETTEAITESIRRQRAQPDVPFVPLGGVSGVDTSISPTQDTAPSLSTPTFGSSGFDTEAAGFDSPTFGSPTAGTGGVPSGFETDAPGVESPTFDGPTFGSGGVTAGFDSPTFGTPGGGGISAPGGGGPSADAPTVDAPTFDTAGFDSPTFGLPSGGAPSVDSPTFDTPSDGGASVDTPTFDAPTFDSPAFGTPSGGAPSFDIPGFGSPTGDTPTATPPGSGVPTGGMPTVDAPTFGSPGSGAPPFETPPTDTPGFETPTVDTPTFDAPGGGGPSFGDPTVDTPTFDTPGVGSPAFDTPAFDTPSGGPFSVTPPSVGPPTGGPPAIEPPSFGPPSFQPPSFGPPSFDPPSFGPPSIPPPTFNPPPFEPPPGGGGVPGLPGGTPRGPPDRTRVPEGDVEGRDDERQQFILPAGQEFANPIADAWDFLFGRQVGGRGVQSPFGDF